MFPLPAPERFTQVRSDAFRALVEKEGDPPAGLCLNFAPRAQRRWLHHDTPNWVQIDQHLFFITVCAAARRASYLDKPDQAPRLVETVSYRRDTAI